LLHSSGLKKSCTLKHDSSTNKHVRKKTNHRSFSATNKEEPF
jgi:hypothetical protein